jgi:ABC-type transporter Mla subunit MlaD
MSISSDSKDMAQSAAETVTGAVSDLSDTAVQQAHGLAGQAKDAVASQISGVATALREAASGLSSGSVAERSLGHIANSFADASESLEGKDLGELVSSAASLAKRNPMIFIGGAMFLGFAASRFMKASSPDPVPYRSETDTRRSLPS